MKNKRFTVTLSGLRGRSPKYHTDEVIDAWNQYAYWTRAHPEATVEIVDHDADVEARS